MNIIKYKQIFHYVNNGGKTGIRECAVRGNKGRETTTERGGKPIRGAQPARPARYGKSTVIRFCKARAAPCKITYMSHLPCGDSKFGLK